jgi:hypothetical protein
MALQFDQYNNQLKANDSTNANANLTLTPAGTGSVLLSSSGNNFLTQTSTLSTWGLNNTTITAGQTDPFGGTNAALVAKTANTTASIRLQTSTLATGQAFTFSVYALAGTLNTLTFLFTGDNGTTANGRVSYNLSTQVITNQSSTSLISSSITSVGGGWYRCSLTATLTSNSSCYVYIYPDVFNLAVAGSITVYGPQLEIGPVLNTYVPTTTTAIYNTPQLTFSGVAGIGLQNDGALYVSPTGSGALQAQRTDSTAVGGNARGANAIDLQTTRGAAFYVASASQAVLMGGFNNSATGSSSVVGGGSSVTASGGNSVAVGGYGITNSGTLSSIVGGHINSTSGILNFIGGGEGNSGTSGTAAVASVATQTTATGSLQVALTATNGNIKVGQLVIGTGMNGPSSTVPYTYVTSIVVTNTVTFTTASVSTTTLTVTTIASGSVTIGMIIAGLTPSTAYTTAQLTATNTAAATPTCSGTISTNTITVSSATSIAVGQFVQPITGIPANTYVQSISGTTITLSQNLSSTITAGTSISFYTAGQAGTYSLNVSATGTPTGGTSYTFGISQGAIATGQPTLNFYTPHGVVVGGGNNQATGSYSFIGGGGNAGDSTRRNTASGDWSAVCGGAANTASGGGSSILGGGYDSSSLVFYPNTASGSMATIVGGGTNTSSDFASATIGSYGGTANARVSVVAGGYYGSSRGIIGNFVTSASRSPVNQNPGISQAALLILGRQTTDATATVLTSDTNAAGTTNQVILPNNSAYYVRGSIVAGVTGGGNSSSWTFQGTIKRGANAAATSLVAAITASLVSQDAGASGWAVSITADTTNGGLAVTVTGAAATTIRWVCKIETTEMTF